MSNLNFYRPETIEEAKELLRGKGGNARMLAGGTDLVGTIHEKILPQKIDEIVALKDIPDAIGITEKNGYIEIGAMTTLSDIDRNAIIREKLPILADAAKTVASPQIRHKATIGGNICQEPRCWYYRYAGGRFNCLRKGGDRCNAVVGNNLYHSIFGSSKVCETPCEIHCPNHTNIPAYMEMIRRGRVDDAAAILFSVNPLAAVTGRICPHTCEQHCNRKKYDESVSIREVERYLGDYILDNSDRFFFAPEEKTGKKITIIGAGPAGLTAAYYLRTAGHSVTIVDQNENIGGMLYYGIPAYRLPKTILARIKDILEGIGVSFRMNTKIGQDVDLDDITKVSDALFVGIGAWVSLNLKFEGNDNANVLNALDFLYKVATKQEQKIGKKVTVIGGGNTSFDVCRSVLKMGAEEVTLLSILPFEEMPAEEDEISDAEAEGVIIRDLTTLKKVVEDEDGSIKELVLQMMKKADEYAEGIENVIEDEGVTEVIGADTVVIAIGQGIDTKGFDLLSRKSRGIDLEDADAGKTDIEDIFAAGDAAHGPATVVKSIFQSRTTADAINGSFAAEAGTAGTKQKGAISFSEKALKTSERVKIYELPIQERGLYTEISRTIGLEDFSCEAERCLNCGCVAVSPSDVGAVLTALDAEIITSDRVIPATKFFDTPVMGSTVLEHDEIVLGIRILAGKGGNHQTYYKYRIRKSIDFPIVSIAINADMDGDTVKSIDVAFGAVAPTPRKAYEVEDYLTGKTLTQKVINTAADMAVGDCMALAENRYKINLLKVLFRRNLEQLTK